MFSKAWIQEQVGSRNTDLGQLYLRYHEPSLFSGHSHLRQHPFPSHKAAAVCNTGPTMGTNLWTSSLLSITCLRDCLIKVKIICFYPSQSLHSVNDTLFGPALKDRIGSRLAAVPWSSLTTQGCTANLFGQQVSWSLHVHYGSRRGKKHSPWSVSLIQV